MLLRSRPSDRFPSSAAATLPPEQYNWALAQTSNTSTIADAQFGTARIVRHRQCSDIFARYESGLAGRLSIERMDDSAMTTGKPRKTVQSLPADGEHQDCDFPIAYIVPKGDLTEAHARERTRWRFMLSMNSQGEPHLRFERYRDV